MTDLFLTDRLRDILPKIKTFVEEELIPLEPEFLNGSFHTLAKKLEAKREDIKKLGLWGLHLPEDMGGMGLTLCEFGQVSEVLARTPFGHYTFNAQAPDIGNFELMHEFGTPAQKEQFMKPLSEGKIRSCFSMTEPEFAGSNPVWMGTTAVKEGDTYVINGHKWFTSSADGASFAIVMAVTNPEAPAHQRASMIIVPTDTPGFELVRNISVMGDAGEGHASHAEVRYTNCRVPATNLLGPEGAGFVLAQKRLGPGRIHHCMRWIGIAERALELMCRRAVSRELNPGETLADKQIVQHWIAEARAEINAARLMVLDTARQIDAKGSSAVRDEISAIKFFVANMMLKVVDNAIQVHGALGVTEDTPLSFWYRHERPARIYDGADEVHKSSLAKRILKQYRS
ncbi:acyl-CoA dehydrogenase family protein [Eisenibacter elegans]|jgi:alkylation response protein AidB-like acyl-CoA dehydrogenase|uniref:acyl-CoA dehydrogenase family protein n=1 Tax=Eisenibacter elegans TaxID=997 RepID=UPI0004119DC9|nr:acyl-CoA dehydrogenase family protein [Eisenibacter elegans]